MPPADVRNSLEPLEERHTVIRGSRLRYFVGGDGRPLVLVHGLAGAASNWVDLAPLLAAHHRLLVPDLPGHDGSSPLAAAATLDPYADRLAALMEHEGFRQAFVAGHSLGGLVALRLAINFPERVQALVLLATAGIRSTTREAERFLTLASIIRPGRLYARHRRAIADSTIGRYVVFGYLGASDPRVLSKRAVEGFLAPLGRHTDTATAKHVLVRDDPRPDLERVTCPVFLVWGARDRQVTVDDAFEFARRLGAPLRVIPDCGHLLIAERADACALAIRDFLHRVR